LFPVLWGLTVFHVNRGEAAVGRQLAEEMLRLAEEEGDVSAQIASHRAMSAALYHLGKWVPTRTHLERVLTLYDDSRQRPPLSLYAVDHRVMALAFLAVTFFALGYPEKGRASASDALDCARELAHPHSHAFALSRAGEFYCVTHEWTTVLALAQDLIALCTEQGFSHYLMTGKIYHGCALAELGETGDSAVLYRDVATARRVGVPLLLGVLGEAQLKGGRPKAAVRLLKGALSRAERTGERWHEAELHRLLGAALSSLPGRTCAEAEACFHRAIMTARTQSAKMWELRATADLARLWLG
jgi:predicted ATPase